MSSSGRISLPALKRWLLLGIFQINLALAMGSCSTKQKTADNEQKPTTVVPVRLVRTTQGFQLQRDGKPFFIKGGAGLDQYDKLKDAGANSVRLWSGEYADDRLDEAHQQGLTVLLGLWLEHESKKFDYYDNAAVEKQKNLLRQQILRYRHHPALLAWSIGNEVNFESANPRLYQTINEIARTIHELDPYHPVTTTLTSTLENLDKVKRFCPDLDFISINSFGNLITLTDRLKKQDWNGPFIVTEFGARGYWESPKTAWGTAKEQTSTQKAQFTKQRYKQVILANPGSCLGSYVFYWGNKVEYTTTWFSLFTPTGDRTATVDVMQEYWTGKLPRNLSPEIQEIRLAGKPVFEAQLLPDAHYALEVVASDPEQDSLQTEWQVTYDVNAGKKAESIAIESSVLSVRGLKATLRTPKQLGAYRVTATVRDGKGSAATVDLPFLVKASSK